MALWLTKEEGRTQLQWMEEGWAERFSDRFQANPAELERMTTEDILGAIESD